MLFYVQPLGLLAECILLELIFQANLPDTYAVVQLAGTEDINDAFEVTPEVLFAFVKTERGQACNVYVRNGDGSFRTFPAYQLAEYATLPSLPVLAAMRCRTVLEPHHA